MFELIAFDADDTLWHNEELYQKGRERLRDILAGYELLGPVDEWVDEIEIKNLSYYGYGVTGFVLSLIEASIHLTNNRISAADLQPIIDHGKEMLSAKVRLFNGARETIVGLADTYPLMLVTKGDLLHQRLKIDQSGLGENFDYIEIVSEKTRETYASILEKHSVSAARFLMVGNSLRSDILPVIELGGWAVHIPNSLTWAHETVMTSGELNHRYYEVESLSRVPALIEKLAVEFDG